MSNEIHPLSPDHVNDCLPYSTSYAKWSKAKRYKAIVFDVGDTLVHYVPNYAEIYGARLAIAGFPTNETINQAAAKAVYLAGGEQRRKEQNGAPRMPDDAFNRMLDEAPYAQSCSRATFRTL